LPPAPSVNHRLAVRLGSRLSVREQDFGGDAGGHQQKAGFDIIECGVEGVAVAQFGGAALEAADDGVSSFLVECDPANDRSNPWPAALALRFGYSSLAVRLKPEMLAAGGLLPGSFASGIGVQLLFPYTCTVSLRSASPFSLHMSWVKDK